MRKGSEHHIAVANLFFLLFLDNSIITGGGKGDSNLGLKEEIDYYYYFFFGITLAPKGDLTNDPHFMTDFVLLGLEYLGLYYFLGLNAI